MAFENISAAKDAKNDEFYTQLVDIQLELNNYTDKFKDKIVFCNCDDPFESNFVKYFLMNFNRLGLKELIATGYKTSSVGGSEIGEKNTPYILRVSDTHKYLVGTQKDLDVAGAKCFLQSESNRIMTPLIGNEARDENGNKILSSVKESVLDEEGNEVLDKNAKVKKKIVKKELYYEAGDFRSDMCLALLKESDIVVTNPPFSLFREFLMTLIKYEKEFLIIGNINCITYKEVFPLLKENKIWLGNGMGRKISGFIVPEHYGLYGTEASVNKRGERIVATNNALWLTNLDHAKRHQMLPLDLGFTYKTHEDMYPTYDNYMAINVDKTNQIPCDYKGLMGVPITFLDVFCPEQFDIVGLSSKDGSLDVPRFHDNEYYNGYTRGKVVTGMESNMPILNVKDKGGTLCKKEGCKDLYQLYWRIFIKYTEAYISSHPERFENEEET